MPGQNTFRKFRADDELWKRFSAAVAVSPDPEADMSKVLRQFCRWYAGDASAALPERPEPARNAERPQSAASPKRSP